MPGFTDVVRSAMPRTFDTLSCSLSTSASRTTGSGPSSETKIGWLPSVTSMPGIGAIAVRIFFSTSRWLSFLSCGLTSWSERIAELRSPLPVSPMVVETMRISGILLTTSSTWTSLSLLRLRLVPTGSVTFMRM